MVVINVKVKGVTAYIENRDCSPYFESTTKKYTKIYSGPDKGKTKFLTVTEKMYSLIPKKGFRLGLGAILWLNNKQDEIKFKFDEFNPNRGPLKEFIVNKEIISNSKFKVKGKERFYFWESLEACRVKPFGSIKLPTGSGKSPIQLTLADNQSKQIGSGIIIVPTIAIKKQFLKSAKDFGIELIDAKYFDPVDDSICGENKRNYISVSKYLTDGVSNKKEEVLQLLETVNWVILDECHHSNCTSWYNVLFKMVNCQRIHGFSACPVVTETETSSSFEHLSIEDARTIGICGPVIYQKSASDLSDFLNMPTLINLKFKWEEGCHKYRKTKNWHEMRQAILEYEDRNQFIADTINYLLDNDYRIITFVTQKDHAKILLDLCNNDKLCCWFGNDVAFDLNKEFDSQYIRDNYGSSKIGIISTSHGIEGLDLPVPINCLFVHEGKSKKQNVQKGGRAVRPDDTISFILNLEELNCNILPVHSKARTKDFKDEFSCKEYKCKNLEELNETLETIKEGIKL